MDTGPSYAGLEALHRTRAMWAAHETQRQRRSDARRKVWLHCIVAALGTLMCMLLVHINVEVFTVLQGSTQFVVEFVDRAFQF
jgi:hypothetical protein